ncbi:MAG: M14 family zinc carboxypeptidase, partial [Gammaproteobacteria bacterium]
MARKDILGLSTLGRPLEALVFSVAAPADRQRFTVMVTASQHGAAEPAGGEALLFIARELAFGELRPLLDDIDIVLMPNTNPDGRDLKRRSNANRVNINTDFVLVKQPETRLLKRALARYRPQA